MEATNETAYEFATPGCAACKHQRRKCCPTCVLAPYFPFDKNENFQAAHKLFGLSNLQKRIGNLDPNLRQNAANALIWEGVCWHSDPVNGAYGEYAKLFDAFNTYKTYCICQYQHPMMRNLLGQDCGMGYNMASRSLPVVEWNENIQVTEGDHFDYQDQKNVNNNALFGNRVDDSFMFGSNHQDGNVEDQLIIPPLRQSNPISVNGQWL